MIDDGPLDFCIVIGAAAFLLYLLVYSCLSLTTESACLAAGWRDGRVAYSLQRYCVNRNDQTDIVKPLYEVRRAQTAR